MVYIKAKYVDVLSLACLLILDEAQLLRNNTRNRLRDICYIPIRYHGSQALPAQQVPTNLVANLRASHIRLRVLFICSDRFLSHGLLRLNRKAISREA